MMVRVNLAQESPVGISVKNPGGARFPGITWAWLTTQNPGSPERQGTVHEAPASKCCVLCSLQQLTLAPGTCQLFLPASLPVDYISSPASSSARHIQEEAGQGVFGTFQGPPRRAASCCRCCPLPCRELEVWRSRGLPHLTGRWQGWRGCPPALGSGGSWLGRRPPAPTCGCWFCVPPSSSACPRCHPRPGERLCPVAATACSTEEGTDLSPPPQEQLHPRDVFIHHHRPTTMVQMFKSLHLT